MKAKLVASSLSSASLGSLKSKILIEVIQAHCILHRLANISLDDLISLSALPKAQKTLENLLNNSTLFSSPLDLPKLKERLPTLFE